MSLNVMVQTRHDLCQDPKKRRLGLVALVVLFGSLLSITPSYANLQLITDKLEGPMGLCVTPEGEFLVAEYVGQRVMSVSRTGGMAVRLEKIPYPIDVLVDAKNRLYITRDGWGANLCMGKGSEEYEHLRKELSGVMKTGGVLIAVGEEYFDLQEGIIAARSGGLRFLSDGTIMMTLRGKASGVANFDPAGRVIINHELFSPNRLVLGADIVDAELSTDNTLILSDRLRRCIYIIRKEEIRPKVLISEGLEEPWGITLDDEGNLYIADRSAGCLYWIKRGEKKLELLEDGLDQPVGLVWNSHDQHLYFTTYGDGSLWRYVPKSDSWGADN